MPPKFFITHSWKDINFASRLCDDLRKHGLDGFFDAYAIKPGDDIAGRIAKGLEECDVYMPLLSPDAIESPWCVREISIAINLSMERERKGRPRIVPVIISPCKLPTILQGILYINFDGRYDAALRELLTKGVGVSIAEPEEQKAVQPIPHVVIPPRPSIQTVQTNGAVNEQKAVQPAPQVIIPPSPSIQTLPRTKIGKDGRERVLIPAGEFLMGSEGKDNEKPVHKVYLDAFYLDRYPVTNAAYKAFVDDTKHRVPDHWENGKIPQGRETHPVVDLDWNDAVAYAGWAGGRLPTEAEWEKAAGWDDINKVKRRYPWGDKFDKNMLNSKEGFKANTTPTSSYPGGASPYGVLDMAGNVWEWCADWYDGNYYRNSPKNNPKGPDSGEYHILRGGSWSGIQLDARCTFRYGHFPDFRLNYIGFRVAESVSP